MKFTLENQYLNGAVSLMQRMPLAGYQSMARTRFIRALKDAVKGLVDAQKDLLNEYAIKDDDGEFVVENGNYKLKPDSISDYNDAYRKLMGEQAEVNKSTYTDHERDVKDILKACKLELSGDEATIYAALCDALNVKFEKEGK